MKVDVSLFVSDFCLKKVGTLRSYVLMIQTYRAIEVRRIEGMWREMVKKFI